MKQKIYFVLADENLFHPHYFKQTLRALKDLPYIIVGLTIPIGRSKRGFLKQVYNQFFLWGFKGFIFISSLALLKTGLDKLRVKGEYSLRSIAKSKKIPIFEVSNVNSEQHIKYLTKKKIDIIISSSGQIFKKNLLKVPRVACINRHTALLPKYGGVLPVFWAMLNHEKKFGVSIHHMVEKVDQGDVIFQKEIPLLRQSSLFKNYILGFDESINSTIKALDYIRRKKKSKKFIPSDKQYFSFPEISSIKNFRKRFNSFLLEDIVFYFNIFSF